MSPIKIFPKKIPNVVSAGALCNIASKDDFFPLAVAGEVGIPIGGIEAGSNIK